ncbi:MAG: hypothetical protein DRP89_03750 [Candidatus Neomarinimicrobiota bacterium]|nr:MAG: hypothetical protein DRP89_03750 [Candidatus Neomarinimicrobiota bacterium]
MKKNKNKIAFFTSLSLIFLCINIFAQTPFADFEIVESIPVETSLDNPEIRNTAEVWLEMINGARKTLDIEQFYISNKPGEPLEEIILAIEKAAKRGVKVRIIVENNMAKTYPETLKQLKEKKNIEVRIINVFNKNGGVQHSKYFIVDRAEVFIGSQNFDWRSIKHIHEIGLRIQNKEYGMLMTKLFDIDWRQSRTGKFEKYASGQKVQRFIINKSDNEFIEFKATASPTNNIPSGFLSDLSEIVKTIDNAKNSVYVQSLSYSPSARNNIYFEELDNALRRAAIRGVDVRLLVSDWCQKKYEMPFLKSLSVIPNISVKLSTIPEWSGGYISFSRVEHCKFMVVDDSTTWVGSSNWKRDYFYSSRNIGIIVKNKKVNETMKNIFLKSWDGTYSWQVKPEVKYTPKYYGERKR